MSRATDRGSRAAAGEDRSGAAAEPSLGSNQANQELLRRARSLSGILDEIAELQEEAKVIKSEAKSDGYDMKAFGQIVKEMRRGAEYQAEQLQLELVIDTYRTAVGLPTNLEAAQEAAAQEATETPEPKERRRSSRAPASYDDLGTDADYDRIGRAHGISQETIDAAKADRSKRRRKGEDGDE